MARMTSGMLVRTISREIAITAVVAFATLQLFDVLFPFLLTDLIRDYRTLTVFLAILIGWILIEGWSSWREGGEAKGD